MTNLVKVFVGDGASTSTTNKAALVKGDLKLESVVTGLVWNTTASVVAGQDMIVLGVTDKGLRASSTIVKNNITNITYTTAVAPVQKVVTETFTDIATTDINKTYTTGVQIQEDLRMGTYNKNTEIKGQYATPGVVVVATEMRNMLSQMHNGFTANPLTSSGSGRQLVKVERTGTGTIVALGTSGTTTFAVIQGQRQVTASGNVTVAAGTIVSIVGKLYVVDTGVTAGTVFTLDTAYQGATATVTSGTTSGTFGTVAAVTASTWALVFTGVAQPQTGKYDQFKSVDFVVTYSTPSGYTPTVVLTTAIVFGNGQYGQVRDLEELYATQVDPIILYRNWPSENFPINAVSGTSYQLLAIEHWNGSDGNFMQMSQKRFDQCTIIAIPVGTADATGATGDSFAEVFNTWYGSAIIST